MSWMSALPTAFLCVFWVLAPGLPTTYAIGLRGIVAWGAAPVVSIAAVAAASIVAAAAGFAWSPLVAVIPALALAAVAYGWRKIGPSRSRAAPKLNKDGLGMSGFAAAGLIGAAVIGGFTIVRGMLRPDALSQTYDAVFHYNAIAKILADGNGSSLTLGTMTDPTATIAFYPAAWHDLVSLVVLTNGASIPLASNMMAATISAVVWPLSCLVLVRQLVGRSPAAMAIAPVVALAFTAFPWSLMTFGVLWPNLLGMAMVPMGLAAVVTVLRLTRDSAMSPMQAFAFGSISVLALALAHPNTLFSFAALSAAPFFWWLGRWSVERIEARRYAGLVLALALTVTAVGGALYLLVASPLLAALRAFDWPAYQSPAQAAGEVVLNATNGRDAAWAVSAVVVVGILAVGRDARTRWLLLAHIASGGLFLLASALETQLSAALTGVWYNDSYRLAAMLPTTAVPLAVIGLLSVGAWATKRAKEPVARATGRKAAAISRSGAVSIVATLMLIIVSSGIYVRDHADIFTEAYPDATQSSLLTPQDRAFYRQVGELVPPDVVVAQNPWNGSALLWALTGRRVLFPHLDGNWTADQRYLAQHLRNAVNDDRICSIVHKLDLKYLLTGDSGFWPWDGRKEHYPGLARPDAAVGFQLMAADGSGNRLYRITACESQGSAVS